MKMLNEMNPKLRALLAAGLIGTASLGAVSCSMPTNDHYDPVPIEQPAPETPSNPDNPAPETPETPENPGDTEDAEETVTFETLGVAAYAASLARAVKNEQKSQLTDITGYTDLIYKDGFVPVEFDENKTYEDGQTYIRYIDVSDKVIFYIPIDMESDFDAAIAAYKAAHAE